MRPAEIENRQLADFPSAAGLNFGTGLDRWATDNLVFRAGAIRAADWVSRTFFGEAAPFDQNNGSQAGPLPGGPAIVQPVGSDPDDPAAGDHAGYRRIIEGSDGWLYLGYDTIAKCLPNRPLDETIRQVNQLRDVVEASGRTFLVVAVPDKTTMVPEHLPSSYPGKTCATEAAPAVWRKMTTLARVIDLRPHMQAAARQLGRPLYFRQDSHWTHDGALTMVRTVAEHLRPGVTSSWRIEVNDHRTAPADLPRLIGRTGENHATSYRLMPDGQTDMTQDSADDLTLPLRRTSAPVTGMISTPTVVLGDSFSLPASPYLPAAFSDVTQLNYTTASKDPQQAAAAIADNEVVVVQIVERNVAAGTPAVLRQTFIEHLRQELVKRPIR